MNAKEQERAFAEKLRISPEFVNWFLSKTKFKDAVATPVLVRSDNPWYQSPTTGRQSETDILAVFEYKDRLERFAVHIENKTSKDSFRPQQAELYHERAKDWLNIQKWGNYQDYEVILIAPQQFYERHKVIASIFHRYVSHEELTRFLPEFGVV